MIDSTLYQNIVKDFLDSQSVKKTAENTGVSEVRVRRILITEGIWSSDTSLRIQHYLKQGLRTDEIAEVLHTTVKAVQQYLPYSRGLYGETPSASALYSAEYRNRIKTAQERVLRRKAELAEHEGWKEDVMEDAMKEVVRDDRTKQTSQGECIFSQYPGIVCLRELPEGLVNREKVKCQGEDVFRLHLELMRSDVDVYDDADDGHLKAGENLHAEFNEDTRVLKSYGRVQYGETISRDILLPSGTPLYALHYIIQAAFGWENSHLHRFELPRKQFRQVSGKNAKEWSTLVGSLFRSPWMDENEEFWADDYEDGSFKKWLRSKYTGPCVSLCYGEGLIQCRRDVEEFKKRFAKVMVVYAEKDGREFVSDVIPVRPGTKTGPIPVTGEERSPLWGEKIVRQEVVRFNDCPVDGLRFLFMEKGPGELLERLPLDQVLACSQRYPGDALPEFEVIYDTYERLMDEDLRREIRDIVRSGLNSPAAQPMLGPSTDVLYYYYDFGDGWKVRITGSLDACDLVEQGRITQDDIDEALKKIYETYRPVCIAADGLPLVDDAGGISGYVRFLRAINPTAEREYWGKDNMPDNLAYENKQSSLEWAKSLGWKDKVVPKTLL